jgi:hypothetical protein
VERAARALRGCTDDEFATLLDGGPLPRLRERMAELSACLRYEDAARLRDRIGSLEAVVERLRGLHELRGLELCLAVPALDAGRVDAYLVCGGRIAARRQLTAAGAPRLEAQAAIAAARAAAAGGISLDAEHLDELDVVGSFLRQRPPELRVFGLDADEIARGLAHGALAQRVLAA